MQSPTYHLVPKSEALAQKPPPQPNLEDASRLIADKIELEEEAKIPGRDELKSGVYEYPARAHFAKASGDAISIPKAILDQIKNVEYRLFAGLFPEINRAYITLDDKLFLWNFDGSSGQDFTPFALSQIIISVALVKPRADVFVEEIRYLIVVATPTEIRLLGTIFEEGKSPKDARIELHPTSFVVNSDGVHMISICGTDAGRIFMCGKDGCVYELVYQSQDGWFTRKCRKLNHSSTKLQSMLPAFIFGGAEDPIVDVLVDNSRSPNLLLTLARSSEIQVFSLGPQGDSLILLSKYAPQRLHSEVRSNIGAATFVPAHWEIVSLAKVPEVEARQAFAKTNEILVCAVTAVGHRIYFYRSSTPSTLGLSTSDLKIYCVRQCPKQSRVSAHGGGLSRTKEPGWSDESPERVRKTFYENGVLLLGDSRSNESTDSLVAISRDPAVGSRLVEFVEPLDLPQTRIADIAEVRPQFYLKGLATCLMARGQKAPLVGLSELATQHEVPCRTFMVLTSTSVQKFVKLRPVDELVSLLKSRSSDLRHRERTEALKTFAQHYTMAEFCAMCLVIACSTGPAAASLGGPSASRSFLMQPSDSEQLKLEATHAFFEFSALDGQAPVSLTTQTIIRARAPTRNLTDRAAGLALFASRLLRPVWEGNIYKAPGKLVWDAKRKPLLEQLQEQIRALVKFLEDKRFWVRPILGQAEAEELREKEEEHLRNLRHLLERALEGLALLVALAEQPNFLHVVQRIPSQHVDQLVSDDFKDLVTTKKGEQLGEALVKAMMSDIGKQPDQKEDWVRTLQQRCPTYFGQSQMFLFKGDECVTEAVVNFMSPNRDPKVRNRCLSEALQHYGNALRTPRFDLESVCANLRRVHHYHGAVELCQQRAQYIDEEAEMTPEQRQIEKEKCTDSILETLNALAKPETADPGVKADQMIRQTAAEKERARDLVIERALRSPDEHFHRRFYTWFIQTGGEMTRYLYRMESPFLLRFLDESPDKKYKRILKEYYEANHQYGEAALFLHELAIFGGPEYSLDERMEFLSHALNYARMCQDADDITKIDSELIFTIDDQLEICRIQKTIYERLKGATEANVPAVPCPGELPGSCPSHKFACLDQKLFTNDKLYTYAEGFQLWEIVLSILKVEGKTKEREATIRVVWKNIINTAIRADRPMFAQWRSHLDKKIKPLYEQFRPEPDLFPVGFVLEEVQRSHADRRWVNKSVARSPDGPPDWDWVVKCFVQAGVDPLALRTHFEQLLTNSPGVVGEEKRSVLWSCVRLLDELSDTRKYGAMAGSSLLRSCEDEASMFDDPGLREHLLRLKGKLEPRREFIY